MTEKEYPPLVQQHISMIRNLRTALRQYVEYDQLGVLPVRVDLRLFAQAALLDAREPLIPNKN